MPPALSWLLTGALCAGLAYVAWRLFLRLAKGSQSTDDGRYFRPAWDDDHETLARNPDTVFGARTYRVVGVRADGTEIEGEARAAPVSNWVDPLLGTPSWRVPPAPPNPAGTDEERARRQLGLTADEPLPRVMVFTHPEKLPPGGLRCAVVLDDGYDYRPARDAGPAMHSEGL